MNAPHPPKSLSGREGAKYVKIGEKHLKNVNHEITLKIVKSTSD